jgi:predicted GIY-YIG superfamily endonuclease
MSARVSKMLTVKAIERLMRAGEPAKIGDGDGLYLIIRSPASAHWEKRFQLNGTTHWMGLGGLKRFGLKEARERNKQLGQQLTNGVDPLFHKRAQKEAGVGLTPALTLHERVARKALAFIAERITPEAYLYRHYQPNGDLLYVGITLSVLERTDRHLQVAEWRETICLIVIEPFATREEALEAERVAIRNEFPKFNRIHNGHRTPEQELRYLRKRALTAPSVERKRIRREYVGITAMAIAADDKVPA